MYNSDHSSLRFGLYVRKSSEQEDRQEQSIESQLTTLQRYATQNNLTIVKIFEDSASAHKIHNRPNFDAMMKALTKGTIDAVLCWKADRLSRNPVEAGLLIEKLRKQEIQYIVTPQTWYAPKDAFILYIHFGLADQYSIDLSANIKRGNKTKIENGGFCHRAPCGYINDKANKTIIKDPIRFKQVRKMFDLYLTGKYSLNSVCIIANQEWGFKTIVRKDRGGNPIVPRLLQNIFISPFYYGVVYNGKSRAKGKHPPMISKIEYDKIQQLLRRYGKDRGKQPSNNFAYTGLINCGECKRSITAEIKVKYSCPSKKCTRQHSAKKPRTCKCGQIITSKDILKGNWYVYYRCTKKKRIHNPISCKQPCIRKEPLEEQVYGFLDRIDLKTIFIDWTKECLDALNNLGKQNINKHQGEIKTQLNMLKKRGKNLITMRSEGELTKEQFLAAQQAIFDEQIDIKENLKSIKNELWLNRATKKLSELKISKEKFLIMPTQDKKHLLNKLGSNFLLKDKKLNIEPNSEVKVFLGFLEAHCPKTYRLEPALSLLRTGQIDVLKESYEVWWSKLLAIRTIFQEDM